MPEQKRDEEVLVRDKEETQKPKRYKVLLMNDDFTSMEFVISILQRIFRHTQAASTRITLQIHNVGVGVAGIYTREIAETRIAQVEKLAEEASHPLQATMEPE